MRASENLRIPKVMVEDDIKAYLEAFERVALAVSWDLSRCAHQLSPLLSGQAQAAYRVLSWNEASDYQTAKKAILYRFKITPECYC